jgi:hypothetical protein
VLEPVVIVEQDFYIFLQKFLGMAPAPKMAARNAI